MDAARFDDFVRRFGVSLGHGLRQLSVGALIGGTARPASVRQPAAAPAARPALEPPVPRTVCSDPDTSALQDRALGELVAFEGITPSDDPNFPPGARAWRVLYVSTGRDNTERTLVCGVVMAPSGRSRIFASATGGRVTGRVVALAHGTLGMVHRCQPSTDPANLVWGQTPWGANVISWETGGAPGARTGTAEDGIMAGMMEAGWIVAATDYEVALEDGSPQHPYAIGKIEAANVIDSVRAAHRLLRQVDDDYDLDGFEVATWGHSQGGHAALWAAQLLTEYTAMTPAADDPALTLAGVALEAPAANFVTSPAKQSATAAGFGLIDWNAAAQVSLTGVPEPVPLGPFFFSYLFGTWAQRSRFGHPDAGSMPAYPDVGALDLSDVVTPAGERTIAQMMQQCWADGDAVAALVAPFRTVPFLQPELADGAVVDGLRHGSVDRLCASNPPQAIANWCAWLRYNDLGPLGEHHFAKLPWRGDRLAPVLIAAGSNDEVVHCVSTLSGTGEVPSAQDCMPVALYEALAAEYCPNGERNGHLALRIWGEQTGVTVADHSAITGLVAAASIDQPTYQGSPLQQFLSAAFEGTLQLGCSARVANQPGTA